MLGVTAATAAPETAGAHEGKLPAPDHVMLLDFDPAAEAATGVQDFSQRLQVAGMRVRLRTSGTGPDQATGYAVALPGHHTASGDDIWYSGGNPATDLTLPQLERRWSTG